ncbi:MAG: DUF3299 domain-containing protein [Gammaproteobacteria bacterium]|nr:DUF3299 domain-containing protein [Gammaproteobacteria bacterium]
MKLSILSILLLATLHCAPALADDYKTLEWLDLMPKSDLDALMNPPEALKQIQDGTPEDEMDIQSLSDLNIPADDPYQKALVSTKIIAKYNKMKVRIPGFVVPLEFDDDQVISAFFLVPYFGACIHQPAPPPNQMIYVTTSKGLKTEVLYEPFWIEGTIFTESKSMEIGLSAYSMSADKISPYTE